MNNSDSLKVIKALASGVNPFTGEEFSFDHICQNNIVIRALNIAISSIEQDLEKKIEQVKEQSFRSSPVISDESLIDKGQLVDSLKLWRFKKAKELGWPVPYVLHNVVLFRLATIKPTDLNRLNEINGLGRNKVERFGNELISIISRHNENEVLETIVLEHETHELAPKISKVNKCLACGCNISERRAAATWCDRCEVRRYKNKLKSTLGSFKFAIRKISSTEPIIANSVESEKHELLDIINDHFPHAEVKYEVKVMNQAGVKISDSQREYITFLTITDKTMTENEFDVALNELATDFDLMRLSY